MDTDPVCLARAERALACVEDAPFFLFMGVVIVMIILSQRPHIVTVTLIGLFYAIAIIHIILHTACYGTHMQYEAHGPPCRGDSPSAMKALTTLLTWWLAGAIIAAATVAAALRVQARGEV